MLTVLTVINPQKIRMYMECVNEETQIIERTLSLVWDFWVLCSWTEWSYPKQETNYQLKKSNTSFSLLVRKKENIIPQIPPVSVISDVGRDFSMILVEMPDNIFFLYPYIAP